MKSRINLKSSGEFVFVECTALYCHIFIMLHTAGKIYFISYISRSLICGKILRYRTILRISWGFRDVSTHRRGLLSPFWQEIAGFPPLSPSSTLKEKKASNNSNYWQLFRPTQRLSPSVMRTLINTSNTCLLRRWKEGNEYNTVDILALLAL